MRQLPRLSHRLIKASPRRRLPVTEQPDGWNNLSRRGRSPTTEFETCLTEDDHQLRNPRLVSPRTITNCGTRDLSRRGRSPTTEPETCLIGGWCDMCRRRRLLGEEVEGGVAAGGLYAQQWEPQESSVMVRWVSKSSNRSSQR